jgi:hypothetical protein
MDSLSRLRAFPNSRVDLTMQPQGFVVYTMIEHGSRKTACAAMTQCLISKLPSPPNTGNLNCIKLMHQDQKNNEF